MKLLVSLGLLTLPLISLAEQNPKAYPGDARIKHVLFEANNVVRLQAKTFITTQILFAKDEKVIAVEGGDTSGWIVTYHETLPNMIFVKPTQLNSHTNMTIVTNQRHYYFQISSNQSLKKSSVGSSYAIKFDYPQPQKHLLPKQSKPKQPQAKPVNADYRFSGNAQLIPAHVHDDGRFTYFELSENQPVPAIFAVNDKDGKEAIVNLRREGNTLIVQRLAPQFTLRKGSLVASVFNTQEINRIKQGRR